MLLFYDPLSFSKKLLSLYFISINAVHTNSTDVLSLQKIKLISKIPICILFLATVTLNQGRSMLLTRTGCSSTSEQTWNYIRSHHCNLPLVGCRDFSCMNLVDYYSLRATLITKLPPTSWFMWFDEPE